MHGRLTMALNASGPSFERPLSGGARGILVLAPEGEDERSTDRVVISAAGDSPIHVGPPELGEDHFGSISPGGLCGGRSVIVDASGGRVRISSRAQRFDPALFAPSTSLDADGSVSIDPPDGWHVVGALPVDWRAPADGSVGLVELTHLDGLRTGRPAIEVLARRITPSMAAALRALLCEDPNQQLNTAMTVVPNDFRAYQARTVQLAAGATAQAGVIANTSAVVFTDDRLLEFSPTYGGTIDDERLGRLIADFVVVGAAEFQSAKDAIDRTFGDVALETYVARLPPEVQVLADGTVAGHRWVLFEGRRPLGGEYFSDPETCLRVVRGNSGRPVFDPDLSYATDCIEAGAPPPPSPLLRVSYDATFYEALVGFARVPVSATAAEVVALDRAGEAVVVGDDQARRWVVFTPPVRSVWPASHEGPDGDRLEVVLEDDAVATITVRDAAGSVLAQDSIGVPGPFSGG